MTNTITSPRTVIISNVELNWAKLERPTEAFGVSQYEVQIATMDASKADELKAYGITVKESGGKFTASLKRKEIGRDGSANDPVRVVDASNQPTSKTNIGNGSTGNVIVFLAPYDFAGRQGVTAVLNAVQITNLVEFTPQGSVDFDAISEVVDFGSDDAVLETVAELMGDAMTDAEREIF